ncbi:jg22852, partial [Pararge aegeria aegeria]
GQVLKTGPTKQEYIARKVET